MQHLDRLRLRLTRLILPSLFLGIASAVWGFTIGKSIDPKFMQILDVGLLAAVFILWLMPSLGYLGTFVDVYNDRIVLRKGIFGRRREIMRTEIADVSASAIKGVVISLHAGEVLNLKGYSKPREIAELIAGTAK